MKKAKGIVLALILVAVAVCVVGTTLAWLNDQSEEVVNTFSPSNIDVKLEETPNTDTDDEDGNDAWFGKMVPGWKLDKDPKAWVEEGSEECYLFVEIAGKNADISENTGENAGTYSLGEYIVYAVDSQWTALDGEDNVFYMVLDSADKMGTADDKYNILGAGTYVDPMNPDKDTDNVTISWDDNQVATKPSVTREMMGGLSTSGNYPKLTFKAYAVQLWKTNESNDNPATEGVNEAQFTPEEAWAIAKPATQPEGGAGE